MAVVFGLGSVDGGSGCEPVVFDRSAFVWVRCCDIGDQGFVDSSGPVGFRRCVGDEIELFFGEFVVGQFVAERRVSADGFGPIDDASFGISRSLGVGEQFLGVSGVAIAVNVIGNYLVFEPG